MSKFEEYDFYAVNKDFLVSDSVITFTDTNGKLMALKPDTVRLFRGGEAITLPPEEAGIGDELIIYPGERIALDGVVLSGSASLSTAAQSTSPAFVSVSEGM